MKRYKHNEKKLTTCTHLWLSCEPRRLDMVSSKFWRRSRTFCTVRFLWDSGSAGQPCGNKKVANHLACQDKTQKKARRRLFYVAFMWPVLVAHTLPPRASVPACIICAWTDVTDVILVSSQVT